MSGAGAQSAIESEFAEAKDTARAYLRAVGVPTPDEISMPEYRKREIRIMRNAILEGGAVDVDYPRDPFACHATILGHRYRHYGYDSGNLEVLLEKDRCHPAYREALVIVVCWMREKNSGIPERLRRWEQERGAMKGRWRLQAARDYLIGLLIEAMATGNDTSSVFTRHRDPNRGDLERDLKRVYAEAGDPHDRLFTKDVVAALNTMKGNRWRRWNDGKGLTESELSEFLKQPSSGEVHAIKPEAEVRTCFPNLLVTRNPGTNREVSICDAVRHALAEGGQSLGYQTVVSIWKRYKKLPVL